MVGELLKLWDANNIIEAVLIKATEIEVKLSIAVVDPGGHLIAMNRMDGAPWGDIDFAINKAYSSVAWRTHTENLAEDSKPTGPYYGMHFSNQLKVVTFCGGAPLYKENDLVGGLGVSGGRIEEDRTCLVAGLNVFK